MSQDNCPEKREEEGAREGGRRGERKEGGKKKEGKGREGRIHEHLYDVMRLCSAVVKVTAFSQSPVLNPDSTLPWLSDP